MNPQPIRFFIRNYSDSGICMLAASVANGLLDIESKGGILSKNEREKKERGPLWFVCFPIPKAIPPGRAKVTRKKYPLAGDSSSSSSSSARMSACYH